MELHQLRILSVKVLKFGCFSFKRKFGFSDMGLAQGADTPDSYAHALAKKCTEKPEVILSRWPRAKDLRISRRGTEIQILNMSTQRVVCDCAFQFPRQQHDQRRVCMKVDPRYENLARRQQQGPPYVHGSKLNLDSRGPS